MRMALDHVSIRRLSAAAKSASTRIFLAYPFNGKWAFEHPHNTRLTSLRRHKLLPIAPDKFEADVGGGGTTFDDAAPLWISCLEAKLRHHGKVPRRRSSASFNPPCVCG